MKLFYSYSQSSLLTLIYIMQINPYALLYLQWTVQIPQLSQAILAQPVSKPQVPSSDHNSKKYNRTWRKKQIEDIYSLTTKYCLDNSQNLEDLTLKDFQIIGEKFPQTPEQIMIKVNEIHQSGTLRPGIWSTPEDDLLVKLINKGGEKWGQISNILNKEIHNNLKIRSGKQCKERWNNYLNPNVNRGPWTEFEDAEILRHFRVHAKKWSVIAKLVENRTESAVKNRIKSLLNKIKQNLATLDDLNTGIDEFIRVNQIKGEAKVEVEKEEGERVKMENDCNEA